MHDGGLAARGAPVPLAISTSGRAGRLRSLIAAWSWLDARTLAAFDAFVVLGLLGIYLKRALLAPQWGAVARFLGHTPGEPLGWIGPLGFFASDLALNLLIVPFAGTAIVGLAFGRWRVLAACLLSAVLSLVYFVELRASSEVGQYISGEMLHDFIGWSATHPSGAVRLRDASPSMIKLAALLTVAGRAAAGLARRHHGRGPAPRPPRAAAAARRHRRSSPSP